MKQRRLWLLVSCCLLLLSFILFPWLRDQLSSPAPQPSVQGGYYDAPFTLTFHAPEDGVIYYTTDGSMPNTNASVYVDGIPIYDRSQEPNRINAVRNIVPDWKNYTPDPTPVDKGTVIRAIYVNELGLQSEVLTQTYFVGLQPPERGYTLCLAFEYTDMFGEDGIYVTGKEYDDWYLSENPQQNAPIPNFEKDTEIAAVMELIDANGDVLNQACGLRLQGATARAEYRKRFTLVSRTEYSGSQTFEIPLFDNIATHSVMLKSYLPDAICADLLHDRSVTLQRSFPVRVFLNGEYLYSTYLLERYDSQYFRQHYQVDDCVLVKNAQTEEIAPETPHQDAYEEFLYWVRHTDFSDPSQWNQIQKEISVQSFIDYIAANYFLCNIDFSDDHNYVLWRSAQKSDDAYNDMRWRWCIYDIDALVWIPNDPARGKPETINVFSNDVGMDINGVSLYRALKENPEFRRQFVLSFMDMLNSNFSPNHVEKVLKKYGFDLSWQDGYFQKRPSYAVAHLAEEFALKGKLESVSIRTANPEMGSITVNTSQIPLSSGEWSGQYFTDYPITVTAEAKDGYQFLGWKGAANESSATLTLSVDGGISLEAVFAEET